LFEFQYFHFKFTEICDIITQFLPFPVNQKYLPQRH